MLAGTLQNDCRIFLLPGSIRALEYQVVEMLFFLAVFWSIVGGDVRFWPKMSELCP
jgi:hypothetical protein